MDAAAYQMSFDERQLALLCANYDRRIDSLDAENKQLQAENAKLREELADAPKCETCEAMLDCYECLRADSSQKERKRLDYENGQLRELVCDMWRGAMQRMDYAERCEFAGEFVDCMRVLEVDA